MNDEKIPRRPFAPGEAEEKARATPGNDDNDTRGYARQIGSSPPAEVGV